MRKFHSIAIILSMATYRIEDTDLTPDEENRGFGGSDTDISKYPFVAGLILERTDDEPICGGTLVAPLFVMTSAYCIEPFTRRAQKAEKIRVVEFFEHPELNNGKDVALLKLEKPSTRKPAPLADINRSDEKCGTMAAAAAGWGYTKEHAVPDTLQVVDVKIILDNECVKYSVNTDVTLCAGTEHGEGVCYGDYGSPLIANGAVVGIASNVSLSDVSCGDQPELYIRVSEIRDFVTDVVNGGSTANVTDDHATRYVLAP
ncbi:Trypsin [Phytophthora infestans]|uniref:Trypsin n=1 Tax=Phytophthora infestans TaxID=4787 RepID=A0A833SMR1_PHYIN|nr:Trypsin [Phytophthora infestans]KAF4136302.1 Trypsin [Phytophthora infestans]